MKGAIFLAVELYPVAQTANNFLVCEGIENCTVIVEEMKVMSGTLKVMCSA